MKLSHVVIASLVGMGASSIGVSWAVPPPPPAAPVVEPPAAAPAPALAVAATTAVSARFVAEAALRLEARMGHAALPTAAPGETFVLVEVGTAAAIPTGPRAPIDVAIVLDRSGSMRGKKLAHALAAVRTMVAQLRPDDTLALVTYADRAQTMLAPTPMHRLDRRQLERTLDRMRTRGHTCISCGVDEARRLVGGGGRSVARILLLSDGQANRGVVDPAGLRAVADRARSQGVAIATIGVDVDYDERTMLALSEASNGRHYFVEDSASLASVFEQERAALAQTVAARADLEVRLAEGVELIEVVDRSHSQDGGLVTIPLGAFADGDEKTALLRVRVAPGLAERQVAQLKLAYRDVAAERDDALAGAIGVRFDDALARTAALDPAVDARLGRKDTFDALLRANAAFARGEVEAAEAAIDDARTSVKRRKAKSGGKSGRVEADFDRQLEALGDASGDFRQAARNVKPAAAPKQRAGKVVTRKNASVADPFSN